MWYVALALMGTAAAAPAPARPLLAGAGTSVAVERASGRVAVFRNGRIDLLAGVEASAPEGTLVAPDGPVTMVQFRDATVAYAFTMPRGGGPAMAAVLTSGLERLIWPNSGIGPVFPDMTSRLTGDAGGVYSFLRLDAALRDELGVPADIPDGAGTVASYRFADDTLYGLASTDFTDAAALAPRDLLIALKGGGMLRHRSPGGTVWRQDRRTGSRWVIADLDPSSGTVLVVVDGKALETLAVDSGASRWRLDASTLARGLRSIGVKGQETNVRDARLLRDGRALLLGGETVPWLTVCDPKDGALAGDLLSGTGPLGVVTRLWAAQHHDLTQVFEVKVSGRPALLLQGPDGWYALPLPGH
jgi:hypothetical protein